MAKTEKTEGTAEAAVQGEPQEPPTRRCRNCRCNDANAIACYANFCRVTGSPEELIIDFGLNPQPVGMPKDPIEVKQRIIVNFFTAKRLLAALQMSVQRHEAVFGVLETDIQKRLRPQAVAQMQQQQQQQPRATAAKLTPRRTLTRSCGRLCQSVLRDLMADQHGCAARRRSRQHIRREWCSHDAACDDRSSRDGSGCGPGRGRGHHHRPRRLPR